jgi:hypothetical protein
MFGFEFFGFSSKRRTALRAFDAALVAGEVNPAYVDDGMRYAVFKWASAEQEDRGGDTRHLDWRMADAAAMISFYVLGPAETENVFGGDTRRARETRFRDVLATGDEDAFDARLLKLVLAKGIAAPDIASEVSLDSAP